MKYSKFIVLLFCIFCQLSFGQTLKSLAKVENSYLDSVDRSLILPNQNLKKDINGNIFVNNKLLFEPKDEFVNSIYELFNNRFLVITAMNEKSITSNLIYILPKSLIIIIDTQDVTKVSKLNINNSYIHDIYYAEGIEDFLVIKTVEEFKKIEIMFQN